jgi:hypothetical protein
MSAKDQAAYMREYRAKKKARVPIVTSEVEGGMLSWDCPACGQRVSSVLIPGSDGRARIEQLETEVAHLKRELAKRPSPEFTAGPVVVTGADHVLNTAEVEALHKARRSRQAVIDQALGKVNRVKKR